jgi:hypothetical protein
MPYHTNSFNDRTARTCALLMGALGLLHVLVGPVGVAVEGASAILGTLAAVGGGLAAGGIAGGFLSRPDKRSPDSFVPEENEDLFGQADRMRDPSYGFGQFRQLARDSAGTMDQTLQATAATGGSERLARTRQQEQVQQAANDIMDRFGQFRLQAQQQAANVQQQGISNLLQGQQMAQRQNLQRSQATQNLFGSIANLGAGLAGQGLGQMMAPSGGGMSFGQMRNSSIQDGGFYDTGTRFGINSY